MHLRKCQNWVGLIGLVTILGRMILSVSSLSPSLLRGEVQVFTQVQGNYVWGKNPTNLTCMLAVDRKHWMSLGEMRPEIAMAKFCYTLQTVDSNWSEYLLEEKHIIDEELRKEWERQEVCGFKVYEFVVLHLA